MLHFFRTGLKVNERPVLAIVLSDIAGSLSNRVIVIRRALVRGKLGLNNITKDFLRSSCSSSFVTRGVNNFRRKCEVVFTDCLPDDVVYQLNAGWCKH